jgi:protein gp37
VPLLPNIWLGITVVSQAEADRDVPKLLHVPARVRFLSIEPMLGPVDLTNIPVGGGHGHHEFEPIITGNALCRADRESPHLHWVICGGESGPKARPMHPDWARSLRHQCKAAGVPFLFKQWGEWLPPYAAGLPEPFFSNGGLRDLPVTRCGNAMMTRVGKKAAGRALDGRTHDGFPT